MPDWLEAASEARSAALRHLEHFAGVDPAPTDLTTILDGLGIWLEAHPCHVAPEFTGVSLHLGDVPLVIVNTLLDPATRAAVIAREIGKLTLPPAGDGISRERQIASYAAELLLPARRVRAQVKRHGPEITLLAKLNGVPVGAMRERLTELYRQCEA